MRYALHLNGDGEPASTYWTHYRAMIAFAVLSRLPDIHTVILRDRIAGVEIDRWEGRIFGTPVRP